MENPTRGKVFTCAHRVAYNECTTGNHVYHSRFLDMLERARSEFFRSLGYSFLQLQNENMIFPVVRCELHFHSMARYDDLLEIDLWLTGLGRASFSCAGRIRNSQGGVLFDSEVQLGCTTIEGKIQRLPASLRDGLKEFMVTPTESGLQ